jgi:hypothetical protein
MTFMLSKDGGRDRHKPMYSLAIGIGRVLFGGLLQLKPIVVGIELIPHSGGAVLALTHFGYVDFALTERVVRLHTRRRIRFLATEAAFDMPVIGWRWQPAHLGRTAPTPEIAAVAEAERQRRKAAARGR